ncbi:MAG TPA: glycosyltransferase [Syntrophomonadaceae bacterium]|nr:glycosyltransferase [Syntrophomonadaceae bacterium]
MLFLQVSRFYIIGLINTAIDFGIFNLLLACCHEPSSTKLLGINTLAVSLAMINSYICNGRWTFNQLSLQPYQISRFTCASLMGMLINSLIVWAGSCIFSDHIILWLNLSKAAAAVVSSTWNFLAYKYWVFSPTCTSTARDAACSQPADRKIPSPCHNSNPLQEGGGKIAWLSFLSRLKVACKSCFKSASRSDHPEQKAKIKDPVPPMIPGLISLIIPAYNEAQRLPGRLQQLLEGMPAAKPWEIIIVDDGSSDETLSIIQEWAEKYPCITTLSYQPNQGKGAAVRTGILSAAGEYVLFVDADESFSPRHIQACINELQQGEDIVIACRSTDHGRRMENESFFKYIRGKTFNYLIQLLLLPGIKDSQCGLKGFHYQAARELFSRQKLKGFAFDVEILSLARALNYRIKELPVDLKDCAGSSVHSILTPLEMIADVIRLKSWMLCGRYQLPTSQYRLHPLLLILSLFMLALAVRLPWLWEVPRFIDELKEIELAYKIYQGQAYPLHNVAHDIGALHNYILAGIFSLLGSGIYWPRLYTALTSAATVVLIFFIGKRLYGTATAWVAAFLLLGNGMHCLVTHMAWSNCTTPFFFCLALFTLLKAENEQQPSFFILSFFLWGLTLQTHSSALIYLLAAIAYTAGKSFRQRSSFTIRHYLWAFTALIAAYANMIYYNLLSKGGSFLWLKTKGYALEQNPGWASYFTNLQAMIIDLLRSVSSTYTSQPNLFSYFSRPLFTLAFLLIISGAVLSWRQKKTLPIYMIVSALLIMPWLNSRFVFFISTRYIMPVIICAILLISYSLVRIGQYLGQKYRLPAAGRPIGSAAIVLIALLQLLPFYQYCHEIQYSNLSNHLSLQIIGDLQKHASPSTLVLVDPDLKIENDPLPILLKLNGVNYAFLPSHDPSVMTVDNRYSIPCFTSPGKMYLICSEKNLQPVREAFYGLELASYKQDLLLPHQSGKRKIMILSLPAAYTSWNSKKGGSSSLFD